nr:MAG TPA: hypothetical protein [Caudoviricetes sp.]
MWGSPVPQNETIVVAWLLKLARNVRSYDA